jgi:hypothetical protein
MTYEELIVAVTKHSTELPQTGLKLLLHLITTGITEGTNEIQTSTRTLAKNLKCSKDKVGEAVQSLRDILQATVNPGIGHTFHLPPEWFQESRGIFTPLARVEKLADCPGNQDTTVLETRTPDVRNETITVLETRTPDASLSWKPGHSRRMNSEYQDTSVLETRTPLTQNQQLADVADVDRSIGSIEIQYNSYESIEHIACAKTLTTDQRSDAIELSSWLRSYLREFGPPDQDQRAPDQQILARCLAVAPLGSLLSELKKMQQRCVRAGSQYAWFVTVFAQRLKGIPSNVLMAAYRDRAIQQRRRPQRDLDFSTRMTDEIRQRARRIG